MLLRATGALGSRVRFAYVAHMDSTRLFERLGDLERAVHNLRIAIDAPEGDLARDAAIKRFEISFELAWKSVKLYLALKGVDVRNPRDTLREALNEGIIADGNAWTQMLDTRNLTTHTYDDALAGAVYTFLRTQGLALLEALAQELDGRTGRVTR